VELRGPVLCATDLSEAADAALRQGCAISEDLRATFVVCHVLPEAFNVRVLFPQDAGVDPVWQAEMTRKATDALRGRLDAVIGDEKAAVVEIETGTPHAGILATAERVGAGVIVLGPGATALRVARSASVPVLVARPSPTAGAVLGATDFSDPALPAVHTAAAEARRRGVGLRLLHCLDIDGSAFVGIDVFPGAIAPWPLPAAVTEQIEATARDRLDDAVRATGGAAEAVLRPSAAAVGIRDEAQAIATGLIVVGTRGRTGLARLALGSVAEAVIDKAPCSVLVVPLHPA